MSNIKYNRDGEMIKVDEIPLFNFRYTLWKGCFDITENFVKEEWMKWKEGFDSSLELLANTLAFYDNYYEIQLEATKTIYNLLNSCQVTDIHALDFYRINYFTLLGGIYSVIKDSLILPSYDASDLLLEPERIRVFYQIFHNSFEVIEGKVSLGRDKIISLSIAWRSEVYHNYLEEKPTKEAIKILNKEVLDLNFDLRIMTISGENTQYLQLLTSDRQKSLEYFKNELYINTVRSRISEGKVMNEKPKTKRITLAVIALKHFYEGKVIERSSSSYCSESTNADNIAKKYKYFSPASGEALYQEYNRYRVRQNRLNDGGKVTLKTIRKYIEEVILLLDSGKKDAEMELETIKNKLSLNQ